MADQPGQTVTILVIDDELGIIEFVRSGLRKEGYHVEIAQDGPTGLSRARQLHPDVVVLDVMLPGIDGLNICRQLRADPNTQDLPILMISAKEGVDDRVRGLEMGADDYLIKPFDFVELLARIRVILRRQQRLAQGGASGRILRYEDMILNEGSREVTRAGRRVSLTATEFNLLQLFMTHPKQVLSRQIILDRVWGYDFGGETNIIEVYVRYLREKLEDDPSDPRMIQTVRGVGYTLRGKD